MTFKTQLIALGIIAAVVNFAAPAQAGTCQPVTAYAKAADPATATTRAQARLTQKAARIGGRVTQTSTNCEPGPVRGYTCKIKAVVCPT